MAFASRHENRIVADPNDPAILALNAILCLKAPGLHKILFCGLDDRMVLLEDVQDPILGAGQPLLLGVTQHRFHLRAHVMPFPVQPYFGDITDRGHLLDEHLVLGFRL